MKSWKGIGLSTALLTFALTAAAGSQHEITRAIAAVHPTEGNKAWGIVEFTKVEGGIRVVATIHGLEPDRPHGFHVHEWGDCSYPDAERAGGHFNPDDAAHGPPWEQERHIGDLGNIEVDARGVGRYHRLDPYLSFSGENSIIGRAVVIHQNPDDLRTQPTGEAGPRIGCGVIGIAEPQP